MAGEVDWTERGEYIAKHGLTPDIADEAWLDPDRLMIDPDPASISGRTIRVIGWSPTSAKLVTVIVLPDGDTIWAQRRRTRCSGYARSCARYPRLDPGA